MAMPNDTVLLQMVQFSDEVKHETELELTGPPYAEKGGPAALRFGFGQFQFEFVAAKGFGGEVDAEGDGVGHGVPVFDPPGAGRQRSVGFGGKVAGEGQADVDTVDLVQGGDKRGQALRV